jgi:hypothetical protein
VEVQPFCLPLWGLIIRLDLESFSIHTRKSGDIRHSFANELRIADAGDSGSAIQLAEESRCRPDDLLDEHLDHGMVALAASISDVDLAANLRPQLDPHHTVRRT